MISAITADSLLELIVPRVFRLEHNRVKHLDIPREARHDQPAFWSVQNPSDLRHRCSVPHKFFGRVVVKLVDLVNNQEIVADLLLLFELC